MVTFLVGRNMPVNLSDALMDVHTMFASLAQDIDQLPIITFDPLYTKPVNLTSIDIVEYALEQDIEVKVKFYTQNYLSYLRSPVNAHVKENEPDAIYFNDRMFTRGWNKSVSDYRETILHELTHIFDRHSPHTFGHGKNSLKGKDNTAPVKLAKYLNNLCMVIKSDPVPQLIW